MMFESSNYGWYGYGVYDVCECVQEIQQRLQPCYSKVKEYSKKAILYFEATTTLLHRERRSVLFFCERRSASTSTSVLFDEKSTTTATGRRGGIKGGFCGYVGEGRNGLILILEAREEGKEKVVSFLGGDFSHWTEKTPLIQFSCFFFRSFLLSLGYSMWNALFVTDSPLSPLPLSVDQCCWLSHSFDPSPSSPQQQYTTFSFPS